MGDEASKSLSATQEIQPPTAADVLEVFQHFRGDLLARIDKRDENILKLIQKSLSEVLREYARTNKRADDLEKRVYENEKQIDALNRRHNELSSEVTTLKMKVERKSP